MQATPVAEWTQLSRVKRPLNLVTGLRFGITGPASPSWQSWPSRRVPMS